MQLWLSASATTPATLALITEVGPPDWATRQFPTSSAMGQGGKGSEITRTTSQSFRPGRWQTKSPTGHPPDISRILLMVALPAGRVPVGVQEPGCAPSGRNVVAGESHNTGCKSLRGLNSGIPLT